MPRLSLNVGILLIALGILSYYTSDAASITAMIPSLFGLAFCLLGILGMKSDSLRKHAMNASFLLASLGLAGSFSGFWSTATFLFGGPEPLRMQAAISQSVMAVLCLLFLILGIKSRIDTRKKGN